MMRRIGGSKVTKLKAKADIVYPLIRLPKTFVDTIGKTATIFETQLGNKRSLIITFGETTGVSSDVRQPKSEVIQLSSKVIQPEQTTDIEARLSALESEIDVFKSLLLLNEGHNLRKTQKNDGPDAIRTHDLRRVKATS